MILERCKWRMFWETNTSVYLWYINVQLTHPSWTDDWLLTSGAAPPALTFSHINCILVFDAEIQNNQCSGFSNGILSMRISYPQWNFSTWPKSQNFYSTGWKDKYCSEGGGDLWWYSLKQVRFGRGVMGGNRVYFRFLLRWRGPKSTFYYFFGGSKSVISKRSVISNPRLASGFQENLSCKTQMNVCAP